MAVMAATAATNLSGWSRGEAKRELRRAIRDALALVGGRQCLSGYSSASDELSTGLGRSKEARKRLQGANDLWPFLCMKRSIRLKHEVQGRSTPTDAYQELHPLPHLPSEGHQADPWAISSQQLLPCFREVMEVLQQSTATGFLKCCHSPTHPHTHIPYFLASEAMARICILFCVLCAYYVRMCKGA